MLSNIVYGTLGSYTVPLYYVTHRRVSTELKERVQNRPIESQELRGTAVPRPTGIPDPPERPANEPAQSTSSATEDTPPPPNESSECLEHITHEEDMAWSSGSPQLPLTVRLEGLRLALVLVAHAAPFVTNSRGPVAVHCDEFRGAFPGMHGI